MADPGKSCGPAVRCGKGPGWTLRLDPEHQVAVDYWSSRPGLRAHFLTHLHRDHTHNLTENWSNGTIYTSRANAVLLRQRFPRLAGAVKELEIGETYEVDAGVGGKAEPRHVNVTALDAGHCAGSVMFLFEGPFIGSEGGTTRVLHTGDTRLEDAVAAGVLDDPAVSRATVDILLLDNTYCSPLYDFPSRAEATEQVLEIIRRHPEHEILIGVDKLGKEELLEAVARELGSPVCVPRERHEAARLLAAPPGARAKGAQLVTDDPRTARAKAVPRRALTRYKVGELSAARPTIGILPTGWSAVRPGGGRVGGTAGGGGGRGKQGGGEGTDGGGTAATAAGLPDVPDDGTGGEPAAAEGGGEGRAAGQERPEGEVFGVPYSLHSSFSELRAFVAALRPRRVAGTVKSGTGMGPKVNTDPAYHFWRLCSDMPEPPPLPAVPTPVAGGPTRRIPGGRVTPTPRPPARAAPPATPAPPPAAEGGAGVEGAEEGAGQAHPRVDPAAGMAHMGGGVGAGRGVPPAPAESANPGPLRGPRRTPNSWSQPARGSNPAGEEFRRWARERRRGGRGAAKEKGGGTGGAGGATEGGSQEEGRGDEGAGQQQQQQEEEGSAGAPGEPAGPEGGGATEEAGRHVDAAKGDVDEAADGLRVGQDGGGGEPAGPVGDQVEGEGTEVEEARDPVGGVGKETAGWVDKDWWWLPHHSPSQWEQGVPDELAAGLELVRQRWLLQTG